ncbi:alpha-L-rhamnosidase C-terminal domain-containing protein [Streptomyces beigongshangae]|uniref:alpha-L-rhamnosidase C-terminal domain-containing protein n=1 Tax=Streptomyces beigongshangae TaxID=2841597 RepID=UPI0021A92289|nr:alpha-L-rhamnosidase C-terminal domain-containing protein [Streptomyces sp. REN17]
MANTRHETPYGTVSLDWERTASGGLTARAEIPDGCRATAELPGCPPVDPGPGAHVLDTTEPAAEAA